MVDASLGIITAWHYGPERNTNNNSSLVKDYVAAYGRTPDFMSVALVGTLRGRLMVSNEFHNAHSAKCLILQVTDHKSERLAELMRELLHKDGGRI